MQTITTNIQGFVCNDGPITFQQSSSEHNRILPNQWRDIEVGDLRDRCDHAVEG